MRAGTKRTHFYFRSLVSSTVVAIVIRPLLAEEALEELYRARYDSVCQFWPTPRSLGGRHPKPRSP